MFRSRLVRFLFESCRVRLVGDTFQLELVFWLDLLELPELIGILAPILLTPLLPIDSLCSAIMLPLLGTVGCCPKLYKLGLVVTDGCFVILVLVLFISLEASVKFLPRIWLARLACPACLRMPELGLDWLFQPYLVC